MSDITQILTEIEAGDEGAAQRLLPLVYQELRRLARRQMAREHDTQTLDPTGLVHEAYLRLVGKAACESGRPEPQWDDRWHFFASAAEAMRRILIESARKRKSLKRGGELQKIPLTGEEAANDSWAERWLMLDEALERLAQDEPLAARVAELRMFAGIPAEEAAKLLDISRASAFRYWAYARAKLTLELGGQ